jgi:hypothetical protein
VFLGEDMRKSGYEMPEGNQLVFRVYENLIPSSSEGGKRDKDDNLENKCDSLNFLDRRFF